MNALAHMFARMADDLRVEERLVREFARVSCEEVIPAHVEREPVQGSPEVSFEVDLNLDPEIPF